VEGKNVIVIKANPSRVEEVAFTGETPAERAIEAAVWPAIESIVDRLDCKLRRLNRAVLLGLKADEVAR
jgi:hypothetical protein